MTIRCKDSEVDKLKSSRDRAERRAADAEHRAVLAEQTVRHELSYEFERIDFMMKNIAQNKMQISEERDKIEDTIQENVSLRTKDIEADAEKHIAEAVSSANERADKEISAAREEADRNSTEICAQFKADCDNEIEKTQKIRNLYKNARKWIIGAAGIQSAVMMYVSACIISNYPRNEIAADGAELIGWIAGGVSFISGLIGGIPWAAVRVVVWILAVLAAAALLITPIVLIKKFDGEWIYDLKNDEISRTAFTVSVSLPLFGTSALAARDINGITVAAALYGGYIIIRSGLILKLLAASGGLLAQSWDVMSELADNFRENKEKWIVRVEILGVIILTFILLYGVHLLSLINN